MRVVDLPVDLLFRPRVYLYHEIDVRYVEMQIYTGHSA